MLLSMPEKRQNKKATDINVSLSKVKAKVLKSGKVELYLLLLNVLCCSLKDNNSFLRNKQ